MGDEGQDEEEYVDYKSQIEDLKQEIEALKKSNKTLELKKRESDLSLNKIKTEINSLRSLDKLWKDAAKTVFLNVEDVKRVYDAQIDQMMVSWTAIAKTGERITRRSENLKDVREVIKTLQQRVVKQDDMISQLNGRIRMLTTELEDKTRKVERLSQGIEEEVERLTQPIRERLADNIMMVMKEKAARAQERRDIADLWPANHLLPTILMKYRSLTVEERNARVKRAKEQDASIALTLEIRHNIEESRAWEMKYDDYGRPFYQHNKTGEISIEPPEILSYQPPEGRDELGNITVEPDSDNPITNWQLNNDYKGEVYYKHRITSEIRQDAPLLYERVPVGKTKEQNVAEAAAIVLAFIAEKITKHIAIKKKRKEELEHPLTAEEKRKREKQRRNNNQSAEELAAEKAAELELSETNEPVELSKYQYDIETVEMLAYDLVSSAGNGRTDDLDPEELRAQRRGFLQAQLVDTPLAGTATTGSGGAGMSVRSFPEELYEGETLIETNLTDITIEKIRGIVEELAQKEENLEQRLVRTRNNLKDFSFLLMERIQEDDAKKMKALRELRIQLEKDRKAAEKALLMEKRKKAEQEASELATAVKAADADTNIASCEKKGNDTDSDEDEAENDSDAEEEEETPEAQRPTLESMKASAAEMGLELDLSSYDATNNAVNSTQSVDTEYKADAILPPDDDSEEQKELDLLDSAPIPLTDDELRKELFGDRATLLFGDLTFPPQESDEMSPETVKIAKQLSNYAMFCGFVNLTLEDYPMQVNNLYSLLQDEKDEKIAAESDDDWLTSNFFLTVSSQQLDAHKEAKSKMTDEGSGMLRTGPVDTEIKLFESRSSTTATTAAVSRPIDRGYTPLSRSAKEENHVYQQYTTWKNQQLYAQVVKQHIQSAAVQQIYAHRTKAFVDYDSKLWRERTIRSAKVDFTLADLKYAAAAGTVAAIDDTTLHFTLMLGKWIYEVPTQHQSPFPINWFNHVVSSQAEINTMQIDCLQVELLEGSSDDAEHGHGQRVVTGHGEVSLHDCIGANLGRCFVLEVPILHASNAKQVLGILSFSITAHVLYKQEAVSDDPQELRLLESLLPNAMPHTVKLHTRSQAGSKTQQQHVPTTEAQQNDFRILVAELRGDNLTLSKQLTGDHNTTDLPIVDKKNLKNLPKFTQAAIFLEKKVTIHQLYIRSVVKLIEERSIVLMEQFKIKRDKLNKELNDGKTRQKRLFDTAEDIKKDVIRITKTVVELRKPNKEPTPPTFDDLPPVPYLPSIPPVGGLDARGKKKKALPNADLKTLLESIEKGELDGKETWPFPESFFPSQAQQLKLSKASQVRNNILDQKRVTEEQGRQRILDVFQSELERWDKLEKKRVSELEKAKKECRKINIKYDSAVMKLERYEAETSGLESDILAIQDLYTLQEKSLDRFKLTRVKQLLETQRQEEYINTLKRRLLRALNARRYALEYPQSATTTLQFQEFTKRSDDALQVLQYEIFECKQLLVQEGVRLRHFIQEEAQLVSTELTRVNISIEIIKQRNGCFDSILSRYKFDSFALLSDLEKLKLREADKDDVGIDTVDNWGERYLPNKIWSNGDIIKCQRMIDLLLTKVKITEGYSRSASDSQKLLIDCLSSQWGECYFTIRDSWSEMADYTRAQQLVADTVQFIAHSRQLLKAEREEYITRPIAQLTVQNTIRTEQIVHTLQTHEYETDNIRHSSALILDETRRHLESYRNQTSQRIHTLENSIIELSRECQKVREELLAQQQINDEKTKVLWAFIHTLQTALQQMSGKMEMILEEREKIVIQAKLMADNTRHQLRIERKHCSNLLFIIHSQRGSVHYLKAVIRKLTNEAKRVQQVAKEQKYALRREVWEHLFAFTRLSTDVDALFEFFTSRLANLAGARHNLNDALCRNNAAIVLAALCKNPRPLIRRCAARALGGMGWNGFTEMRILLWDSMMHWKMFKAKVLANENKEFHAGLDEFTETGKFDAILRVDGELEEFVPAGNLSLRNIIKQRRQWALRAARRVEGPHINNQKLLNIHDQVLTSLLQLCITEDELDWEIARNAALAVSIASFEPSNHQEMIENNLCIDLILKMCSVGDAEVQTHAAITIANLCHHDVDAQRLFGDKQTIPLLLSMLTHPVADVLEAATAALANITCYSDHNCQQTIAEGGVKQLISVMTSAYSENLLDGDQNDEVQANAAEALANIARYSNKDSVQYFDTYCIDALVLMCASTNKQLKRNVSLVLGNIAQAESLRHEVGMKGGVEALMLCTEDSDDTIVANALWALENLMWYPPNQERAGRFMSEVVVLLTSKAAPVQRHACELLGNLLYYSATNRVRFLECDNALETLLSLITSRHDVAVVEALLRALLSLSYLDVIALWLGEEGGYIPMLLAFITPPFYSRPALRYSLQILGNLCLHHVNRALIAQLQGIELLVPLHADSNVEVRQLSIQIITHLEDITPPEVLARARGGFTLERLVTLASNEDPLVRAVAAEAIGEELWYNKDKPQFQARAQELGAIDALLAIASNEEEELQSLLPALWSLRNAINENVNGQNQLAHRDGLIVLVQVLRRGLNGQYEVEKQTEQVLESTLACILAAIQGPHERNARRLVMIGLDALLSIVSTSTTDDNEAVTAGVRRTIQAAEGVRALVNTLLLLLGPFNYVVCRNCGRRQDLKGTSCLSCGHRLRVEIDAGLLQNRANSHHKKSSGQLQMSQSAKELPSWRHAGKAAPPPPAPQVQQDEDEVQQQQLHVGELRMSKTAPAMQQLQQQQQHQSSKVIPQLLQQSNK